MDQRIEHLLDELGTPSDQRSSLRAALAIDRSRAAHPSISRSDQPSGRPAGFETE